MGPKYEFTGETMNYNGRTLHRIKRLSDGKIGGWIEKESNLSQEGNCWVDDNAKVSDSAVVSGNARVCARAWVLDNARVSGNAWVSWDAVVHTNAEVSGNAQVYENAQVDGCAQVYDEAKVYGKARVHGNAIVFGIAAVYGWAEVSDDAKVCGYARVHGNAEVCGNAQVDYELTSGIVEGELGNERIELIKNFIYKINESSKLEVLTNYESVDAFFEDDSDDSYIRGDYLTIMTIDTKFPIIKLKKDRFMTQHLFKFVVDLPSIDGYHYSVRAFINSKEKFSQILQSTINALKEYPQFSKYVDDLENCL